jgi:aromatic ring hydroxylase
MKDGRTYLESLRDGREVWVRGERVKDVTTHPAFAAVCQEIARIYDLQSAPETRDTMTTSTRTARACPIYRMPKTRMTSCCGGGATARSVVSMTFATSLEGDSSSRRT